MTCWDRETAAVRSMRAVRAVGHPHDPEPVVGALEVVDQPGQGLAGRRPLGVLERHPEHRRAAALGQRLDQPHAGVSGVRRLDQPGVEHRVLERVDARVVEVAPGADERDLEVGQGALEHRVDGGDDRAVLQAGRVEDDLEVRDGVQPAGPPLVAELGEPVGEEAVVVVVDLGAAGHHVGAAQVPGPGLAVGQEHRARLAEAVAQRDVLAELEAGVHAAGLAVEVAGQRRGRTDVDAAGARADGAQVVEARVVALDPLVRLEHVGREVLRHPVGGHGVAHLGRRDAVERSRVDEPLVAQHHGVVDLVVPAQLGLDVLAARQHVGVEPVDDVAVGEPGAEGARVGAAPALLDLHDARVVGAHLRQHQRLLPRVRAVVDDDQLDEVARVGLGREPGQHVRQRPVGAVRRHHDADVEVRLPGPEGRHEQGTPLVAAYPRLRARHSSTRLS